MLNVAVCDDERVIAERVQEICRQTLWPYDRNTSVSVFTSGAALLAAGDFDLVILDVEMPSQDGFQIAERLRERRKVPYMIFLTSHKERMAEAFYVRAFRYLLKPIDAVQLERAVLAAMDEIAAHQKLIIEKYGQSVMLNVKDILYIEAEGAGKRIYTADQTHFCAQSFEWLMQNLPTERFMQIHKSFLVHLAFVYQLDGAVVRLSNGQKIPIARRKRKEFQERWMQYVRIHAR